MGHILHLASQRNANGYEISSQDYFSQLGRLTDRNLGSASASRSSVSEARRKLNWKAFEYLLHQSVLSASELPESCRWKGHQVYALDGTRITLPHAKEVLESFPLRKSSDNQAGAHYPMGTLTTACQVFTGQPVAARLQDFRGSERDSVVSICNTELEEKSICLLDRGLDGMRIWQTIQNNGQFFVARARVCGENSQKHFQYVGDFIASNQTEVIVHRQTKDLKTGETISFKIRLIRGQKLKDGNTLVIATNLLNMTTYPAAEVLALYGYRWKIETLYGRMKTQMQIEKFHARNPNGVLQEIFANLLILSIAARIVLVAQMTEKVPPDLGSPNFKNATEVVRRNLFYCLGLTPLSREKCLHLAQEIVREVNRVVCKKQPGRSHPRYSKQPANHWTQHRKRKIDAFHAGIRTAPIYTKMAKLKQRIS